MYHIYTDGACSGNKRDAGCIGGFGYVLIDTHARKIIKTDGGAVINTTNNRMELMGAIAGMQELIKIKKDASEEKCAVILDSSYVVDNWNDYIDTWIENKWRKANKQPVINSDLWKILYKVVMKFKAVKFKWIKGHDKQKFNELADEIARKYIKELKRKNKC